MRVITGQIIPNGQLGEENGMTSRLCMKKLGMSGNLQSQKWVETKLPGDANNWQIERKSS